MWLRMQLVKIKVNHIYEDCEVLKFASLLWGRPCVFKPFSSLISQRKLSYKQIGEEGKIIEFFSRDE